ncbi:alcohol dehydrogenase, partial [Colletotrichum incanum]
LAATCAAVYSTAEDLSKARGALGEDLTSADNLQLIEMDLVSLASVRSATVKCREHSDGLDILDEGWGRDGVWREPPRAFPAAQGVGGPDGGILEAGVQGRVVNIMSSGRRLYVMIKDDINFSHPAAYDACKAYEQSKTANILMANGVDRRLGGGVRGRAPGYGDDGAPGRGEGAHGGAEEEWGGVKDGQEPCVVCRHESIGGVGMVLRDETHSILRISKRKGRRRRTWGERVKGMLGGLGMRVKRRGCRG